MRNLTEALDSANRAAEMLRERDASTLVRASRQVAEAIREADVAGTLSRFAHEQARLGQKLGKLMAGVLIDEKLIAEQVGQIVGGFAGLHDVRTVDLAPMLRSLVGVPELSSFAPDGQGWPSLAIPGPLRSASDVARQSQDVIKSLTASGLFGQVDDQTGASIGQLLDRIREAPDEPARRLSVRAALQAAVKGATGVDARLTSPRKRVEFVFAVLGLIISILLTVRSSHQQTRLTGEAAELRGIQRAQAETIAELTITLHEIQEHLAEDRRTPVVVLQTVRHAVLREGPNGATARVATIPPGQRLLLKASYERWHWVEVLDALGQPADVRGWVYRRAVRVEAR